MCLTLLVPGKTRQDVLLCSQASSYSNNAADMVSLRYGDDNLNDK